MIVTKTERSLSLGFTDHRTNNKTDIIVPSHMPIALQSDVKTYTSRHQRGVIPHAEKTHVVEYQNHNKLSQSQVTLHAETSTFTFPSHNKLNAVHYREPFSYCRKWCRSLSCVKTTERRQSLTRHLPHIKVNDVTHATKVCNMITHTEVTNCNLIALRHTETTCNRHPLDAHWQDHVKLCATVDAASSWNPTLNYNQLHRNQLHALSHNASHGNIRFRNRINTKPKHMCHLQQ